MPTGMYSEWKMEANTLPAKHRRKPRVHSSPKRMEENARVLQGYRWIDMPTLDNFRSTPDRFFRNHTPWQNDTQSWRMDTNFAESFRPAYCSVVLSDGHACATTRGMASLISTAQVVDAGRSKCTLLCKTSRNQVSKSYSASSNC